MVFLRQVSLCNSSGCPRARFVDQAGLTEFSVAVIKFHHPRQLLKRVELGFQLQRVRVYYGRGKAWQQVAGTALELILLFISRRQR